MYNAEDDNQSVWQQFMAEIAGQTPQPEVSDGVDRGALRNIPTDELINVRPDTGNAEGALVQLADNATVANDAQPRGLNAYRESGASVKPAKSAAEVYNQLHPEAASRIKRFFELAEERGLGLKPGSMNRDYGTQAKMYANRASNPYPVAPPGGSAHMGFATDFSGYTPQKLEAIRELAREVGLVYGGNWNGKSFDPVHIQLGPGNEVTRYIQQHVDPKAGTVNWEGVRSTQLPEDFIKRALAAAGGQDVNATYVPVKEVKVEGAANATGDVTARSEAAQSDDKVAEAAPSKRGKEVDYLRLMKMLDDSTSGGGATYLQHALQSGAQSHQAARAKTSTQIAQFDQEQVQNLAQALKSGQLPSKRYKEGGEVEGEDTPNIDKIIENLIKERTTEAEIIDNGFKPRDYDPAKITQALSIMSGRAKDPSTDLRAHYNIGKLGLNAGVMQSDKFRGYNAGINYPLDDTSSINLSGNYGRVMGAYGNESPASWGVRGQYTKRFNEGGEVYGYNDGGPKLPDRPEYEMVENPDVVDASPAGPWERMFARVTGGRNLQNDINNIKSRLPTGQDYGHALLEQREATQGLNALSGQNIREGYANRDIPQMALGAGQGALGLVNPALAPINAGFDLLSKTAGKFDPRAKVEADLLGLVGSEGTGVTQKLHNLELPKSAWDTLLKKYQDAGPQAMAIGLPAAVAAAEKPAEAAAKKAGVPQHLYDQGYTIPAYHSTMSPEDIHLGNIKDENGFGVHFGSKKAANERMNSKKEELGLPENEPSNDRIFPVAVRLKNPLKLEDAGEWNDKRDVFDTVADKYPEIRKEFGVDSSKHVFPSGSRDYVSYWRSIPELPEIRKFLEDKGHDGIVYKNEFEDAGKKSYIVFDPKKNVKSQYADYSDVNVEPKGNVNLRPMVTADALKGPEVQTVESFLSQIRGMPGVTKEGFDALVQKYQGMEPNARISKADFEKSIPPSEYGKIDLVKEVENRPIEEFRQQILDQFNQNPERIYQEFADRVEDTYRAYDPIDPKELRSFLEGGNLDDHPYLKTALKEVFNNENEIDIRSELKNFYKDWLDDQVTGTLENSPDYSGQSYSNVQRLNANHGYETNNHDYFELGVTHPNQKEKYGHYQFINPERPEGGMVAHVRGSFMPEGGDILSKKGKIETKPNSAVIEEIQSDAGKTKNMPELHQIHATGFKTGVQHALENGATTVYLPTATSIALVRNEKPSSFAPIYDQEVVKYGLKPLLQIKGVTSKMVGDGAYHEISFTPAAIEAILKGKGQRTPGYADGGIVTDNGQTPDGTGRNQHDAFGNVSEAQGGPVRAVVYDPNRISTMAQQLQEGTYA